MQSAFRLIMGSCLLALLAVTPNALCSPDSASCLASGGNTLEVDDMALLQTKGVVKHHATKPKENRLLASLQRDLAVVAELDLRLVGDGDDDTPDLAPEGFRGKGDRRHWSGGLIGMSYGGRSNRTYTAMTDAEKNEVLEQTNLRRCMHGADPVEWSDPVAEDLEEFISGQSMSTMHHASCYQLPPPAGPAGENLFAGSRRYEPAAAVDAWYSEVDYCNGGPTGFTDGCQSGSGPTGHFTALVWKGVKKIGCAYSDNGQVIGCRYWSGDSLSADTPNMGGAYVSQVGTRVASEAECSSGSSSASSGSSPGAAQSSSTTPLPSTAPSSSVSGPSGNCFSHDGCALTNNCGRTVHIQFDCRYGGNIVRVGSNFPSTLGAGWSGFSNICQNYCDDFATLN